MTRHVRQARFVGSLVFIYFFYFVLFPEVTTALAKGWFEGYRRGSGRDASILEVVAATTFDFLLLGAAWASLESSPVTTGESGGGLAGAREPAACGLPELSSWSSS